MLHCDWVIFKVIIERRSWPAEVLNWLAVGMPKGDFRKRPNATGFAPFQGTDDSKDLIRGWPWHQCDIDL
eukprot:2656092-Amphidinium_carterae.3